MGAGVSAITAETPAADDIQASEPGPDALPLSADAGVSSGPPVGHLTLESERSRHSGERSSATGTTGSHSLPESQRAAKSTLPRFRHGGKEESDRLGAGQPQLFPSKRAREFADPLEQAKKGGVDRVPHGRRTGQVASSGDLRPPGRSVTSREGEAGFQGEPEPAWEPAHDAAPARA
jgi:hypothetical protein